jgi:multiple sugar transport system substrate-binding protein
MSDLTFSCMIDPQALGLDAFQSRFGVHVHVQRFDWGNVWDDLLRIALYGQGPDVSEIGNTWLGSLTGMNALRPLMSRDVKSLGNQASFLPAVWQGITTLGDNQSWAIPFLTDARVIYYRRDWLERADIEEATAFESSESLTETLTRLQFSGIETPWAMPTRSLDVVYNLAPWVWAAGGSFRTSDGWRLCLGEPEAQAGMRTHFDLHRYLSPPAQALNTAETDSLFRQGRAAAVISGPWLLHWLKQDGTVLPDVGIAPVPAIPYIGGTNLVIWRHARNKQAVVELMRYLTSAEIQHRCFEETGFVPSRAEALDAEPFVSDPRYRAFAKSVKSGRVLKASYRWAAVEQHLMGMMSQLWSDLAADPQLDLDSEIAERTAALVENLERTILATW